MKQLAGGYSSRPMQGASASGIGVQLFTDLAAAERVWRSFEPRADSTVFQSFDWLCEWHNHIDPHANARPVIVVGSDHDGQVLIILPLAIESGRFMRRLTWLGSDLCDYNAPLLAPDFNQRVTVERFRQLWREIVVSIGAQPQFSFDMVDMDGMPEAVGGQRNPMLALPVLPRTYGAHATSLGGDWDAFYASRRSSVRRSAERRQYRRLADRGEVRFVEVRDRSDIESTMAVLIEQKRASYERMGVEDLFERSGYRDFYRAVALNANLREVVHLSRLDVGATHAAVGLGLQYKDRFYVVMTSYQNGELARYGPGRAHLRHMLRHAIERKMKTFDFTIGDEAYKSDWCDRETRLFVYREAVTARGRAMVELRTAMSRADLFICERPRLRRPLSNVRTGAIALVQRLRRKTVLATDQE